MKGHLKEILPLIVRGVVPIEEQGTNLYPTCEYLRAWDYFCGLFLFQVDPYNFWLRLASSPITLSTNLFPSCTVC